MGASESKARKAYADLAECRKRKRNDGNVGDDSEGMRIEIIFRGVDNSGKRLRVDKSAYAEVIVEELAVDSKGSATVLRHLVYNILVEKLKVLDHEIMKLSQSMNRLNLEYLKAKWAIKYEDVQRQARFLKWKTKTFNEEEYKDYLKRPWWYERSSSKVKRFNSYGTDLQAAKENMRLLEDRRRKICEEMEYRAPLGDVDNLKKMKVPALKKLAVKRGVKGGRSWANACPPRAKKEHIIDALTRDPRDARPKTKGQGWLPPYVSLNEDNHQQWLHERYLWYKNGNSEEFSKEHPRIAAPRRRHCNGNGILTYENEDAFRHDESCSICHWKSGPGKWDWHCAGCNICRDYGLRKDADIYSFYIPCEKCTPALHYFETDMRYDDYY